MYKKILLYGIGETAKQKLYLAAIWDNTVVNCSLTCSELNSGKETRLWKLEKTFVSFFFFYQNGGVTATFSMPDTGFRRVLKWKRKNF